jgi:hypothetical protein
VTTGIPSQSVTADPTAELLGEPFRLDSITEAPAPDGGEGIWQHYVIVQGTNTINGLRPGTRSEVSRQIEEMVERLNDRFRKGKAGSVGTSGRYPPPVGPGKHGVQPP